MKTIGIVTLFDYINIGNKLQNYAVQELVRECGCTPITIACSDFYYNKRLKRRIKNALGRIIPRYNRETMLFNRRVKIKKATAKMISSTDDFSLSYIQKHCNSYDAYITGSDQVWKDWGERQGELDYRFLNFIPKKKRICLSPSFGFDSIPVGMESKYQKGLNGFETLSCREQSGCDIIKEYTGKTATLLSDPTMMLSIKSWDSIAEEPGYNLPEKYVFIYFLGNRSSEQIKTINQYAKEHGCEIIDVFNSNVKAYYDTTPQEFLYLINRAKYVFTDSFHGTVFSIIYNKKFTCFVREGEFSKMNNRVLTLVNKFGLTDRLNRINDAKYDEKTINDLIAQERAKGLAYLRQELQRATK